jgi:hypothetical protein
VKNKLLKWGLFTIGFVAFTTASDALVVLMSGRAVTADELFGEGELLLVSVGLLVASSGEIIFDRLLRGNGDKYPALLLAFCFLMTVPASVAYGLAKNQDQPPGPAAVQAGANLPGGRAEAAGQTASNLDIRVSVIVFVVAVALSTETVAASARGARP